MKWIGQHVWDFISRFRTTVYIENLETSSEENVLVVDSDGKVTKNTTLGGSDVTMTNGVDNRVMTATGAAAITGESGFTYDASTFLMTLSSSTSASPSIYISNTSTDASSGKFIFSKAATGADDDDIGVIGFNSQDDGGNTTSFAQIVGEIADASNNDEAGRIRIEVTTNSSEMQQAFTATGLGTGSRVDIGLGYGAASTTTIAGTLTMGSTAAMTNAGLLSVAAQTNITSLGTLTNLQVDDVNINTKSIEILGDTSDTFNITTGAAGATTLTTVDAGGAAGHLSLVADGNIYAKVPDQLEFSIVNTDGSGGTSHKFTSEVGAESHLYMYPSGGGVTADYFHIEIGQDGGTTLSTTHGSGTSADLTLSANGRFQVDTTDVNLYMGNHTSQEAGDVSFRSSTTMKPQLILESTANDNKPPSIKFLKDKGAAGADNDYVGTIKFSGDNTAQEETDFARIRSQIASAGDTDEAGKLSIGVAASNDSSSNIRDAIVLTGDPLGDWVDVELGYGNGDVEFKRRKFTKTADATHFDAQGDILYLGGGSTTQGDLCYLKEDGEWGQADADGAATGDDADRDAMGMLAIALGTDPDVNGMLIRGVITMDYDLGDCGNPIYVSTTAGDMTNAAPTASGDFVRVVGYCLDDTNGQIYFNPDNTWVEIA